MTVTWFPWLKSSSHRNCKLACTVVASNCEILLLVFHGISNITDCHFAYLTPKGPNHAFFKLSFIWDVFWFVHSSSKNGNKTLLWFIQMIVLMGGNCYEAGSGTLISISHNKPLFFRIFCQSQLMILNPDSLRSVKSLFIMKNIHLVLAGSFACRKYLALPCSCSIDCSWWVSLFCVFTD